MMWQSSSSSSRVAMSGLVVVAVMFLVAVESAHSHPMMHREAANPAFESLSQHLDPEGKHLSDEDTMEAALLNYLYAKQMVERLRNSQDITELQRKRSYWKQCAFNAVSCFGRK